LATVALEGLVFSEDFDPEATASGFFVGLKRRTEDFGMAGGLENELSPPGERSRPPLLELLLLAGPTIAQMASYTTMQFADTWMLSRLGVAEPTAAGNAGLFAFSIIGFGVGVLFCVNTLVSQHFGQKDYTACGRYLWQGVWFGLFFGVLAWLALPFATAIFRSMGHEPGLAGMEATFFRISVAATGIKLASTACGQFLLAINRPWVVLMAAVLGVSANAGTNYFLIFGHGGFPRMGVAGAAWGTNVGVCVELLTLMCVALAPGIRAKFNTLDATFRLQQMKTLLSIGISSGVQLVADVFAWGIFSLVVMGQFGDKAMAANIFLFRYISVSFMPAYGLSIAVTALVGRYIGAGRPDLSQKRAHLGFAVTAIYMMTCGLFYILGRNQLMGLISHDPEVLRIGAILLIFGGVYQLFDAMYILYNGALRGAGDTFVPAVATAVLCWTIAVGGGYAVAKLRPQWGPAGPWTVASVYGLILGVFMLVRFQRGKWKAINLDSHAPAAKVPGLIPA
jgi:MATE family multidrug resistance protein